MEISPEKLNMYNRLETEAEHLCFWALIPVIGPQVENAFWKIHEKSLVTMATEVALSVTQINRTLVLTSGIRLPDGILPDTRTDVLEINTHCCEFDTSYLFPQIFEEVGRISREDKDCEGMVILDPHYPLRRPEHVKDALMLYSSQAGRPRPWLSVISVDLLPNHFHPRKILKLTDSGALDHFSEKGRGVYQRQQLEGDDYFRKNGTVYIIDPMADVSSSSKNNEILGYVIEEPIVMVKDRYDLNLARALINSEIKG
jgi:CMP-N-acetylneuraminic acid synthetase